jgi:hypothetical protein
LAVSMAVAPSSPTVKVRVVIDSLRLI